MFYKKDVLVWENYSFGSFDMYFENCKICVLDIETTGLSPDRSHFVIGGLLSFQNNGTAIFTQYFAEDLLEERELIKVYLDEACTHDVILTFNGRNFDVPFLLGRAKQLGLREPNLPHNLDLYLVLNKHSSLRKLLPNLKQKTVENFMGLWSQRADTISGAESASLYIQYLLMRENLEDTDELRDILLLHNQDDVLQLGKLLPVFEKTDFHKAMYNLGFPVISQDIKPSLQDSSLPAKNIKLSVQDIKLEKAFLKVSGKQISLPVDFVSYGDSSSDCQILFEKKSKTFEVYFPIIRQKDFVVLDLLKLPFDFSEEFSKFQNFESGYLVFMSQNDIKYKETNFFIKSFLTKVLGNIL